MGKYLGIIRRTEGPWANTAPEFKREIYAKNDINDKSPPSPPDFGRLNRLCRTPQPFARVFEALERRCPDHVEVERWQQAVEDGRRFLLKWGEQAVALGWTARDLFGLHALPDNPPPSYRRLSRYDCTGLCWLLKGRPVGALTESMAAIENATGTITPYRRHNKPALGPVGDSLDDFTREGA